MNTIDKNYTLKEMTDALGSTTENILFTRKKKIINLDNRVIIHQEDALKFLKSLETESVDLIVTDPAYSGMNQHLQLGKGRIVGEYKDKSDDGKWFNEFHDNQENYEIFLNECYRVLKMDSHIFIMFDSFSLITLSNMVRNVFNVKNILTWDKVNIGMGHYFRRQSEFIIFACKGKKPVSRRDISDVWKIKRIHRSPYPTQKPVELFEAMIASSRLKKNVNYLVCDPFLGSGSSAIASLRQGCEFIGSDISDKAITMSTERAKIFIADGVDIYQPNSAVDSDKQKIFW
jgi:site-specific DNA-methyltransferase (adenine-specific)